MAKKALNSKDIDAIVQFIDSNKQPFAMALKKEILFLQEVLERLQKAIDESDAIALFEQGSQRFSKENPAIKSYNSTLQRYNQTLKQFVDLIPENKEQEADEFDKFANAK